MLGLGKNKYEQLGPDLWHCENINTGNCVIVHKLSKHETHHFHRHAGSTYVMAQTGHCSSASRYVCSSLPCFSIFSSDSDDI
jgi:hypothetical protein